MFSIAKCSDHSAGAEPEAGGGLIKTSLPSDEVASAVAAVSDEIGDILKDELGDADRADRIGAELADLSAELGLLAGLADEPQQNFPSLFEIAIGHRGSGSGSSSSSWSGGRGGRRRPPRPQRAPRRRPIAKGKEMSRRRSAAARRAASMRVRRVEVVSDASDVGADSDSDDQWTELDDNSGTTDSSSGKDADMVDMDCPGFQDKGSQVEAPAMGQFLLPLLSADPTGPEPEHFLIRHEDILQLLATAESSVREDLPLMHDDEFESPDGLNCEMLEFEEPPVTPEDEAALLHYVCEAEIDSYDGQMEEFRPVEEWLLGVYHSWCEISALMYTLVGSGVDVNEGSSEWSYRARFGCHCRLCLSLANNERALRRLLRALVCALARGGNSTLAAHVVRALQLKPGQTAPPSAWDVQRLRRLKVSDEGAAIIHDHLSRLALHGEITGEIVTKICLCRQHERPFEKQYAMERFCKLLENFKTASSINFKVELVAGEGSEQWAEAALTRLARCLAPHQRRPTAERLAHMAARTAPHDLSAWSGYKHRCDCLTPRTLCAQQRKQLLRISLFGMMQAMNEFNNVRGNVDEKPPIEVSPEGEERQLQHGDGTGAKPPEQRLEDRVKETSTPDLSDSNFTGDFDDITDSDGNSGGSLGLSTSSSLDSASELLLAAAAAVESGGSEGEAAPGELCRTVRHLMRSIASIERLMDRVLKHCDEWPIPPSRSDHEARKRVDHGLSEVDRKLMAMYQRLPEVHRRQLQVYRKQKKLSTVCAQLVGGSAPAPPAPASPPPAPAHAPCTALCPEYHLQRFKEVRRKVMHMRDQQLYYHRLRMWLEDQLRQERESVPDSSVTLVEELPRRKRRTLSPRATAAPKRKLRTGHVERYVGKPHKLLQLLRHKAPPVASPQGEADDEANARSEAEPPDAFPLEKEENVSDTETIVGEKENDICKDMKDCLVKFANFALNSPDGNVQTEPAVKYPESMSPPLQQLSPTTPEPAPGAPDLVIPVNARAPATVGREEEGGGARELEESENPDAFKYMTFGLEIKKAMEECQNIINSYNSVDKDEKVIDNESDGNYSLEQIVEVIMSLDKNTTELLDKMDTDESVELNSSNAKLAELVENMPQILANMPEIASKLSEFANASFELPEFASIMNSLPEVNNEAQLTPETLKQIRDLKLSKRDSIKVTKNTAKRKINRKYKNSENDVVSTMAFEFESKDITDLLKEDRELQALIKSKTNKEDVKDLLFSMSAQAVVDKVFEHLICKTPDLAKYLDEENELFLPSNNVRPELLGNSSTLFDDSVKDVCSMDELRELVKSRFNSWKHYVATKFNSIPVDFLDSEIEIMLDKIYVYIQDLTSKENGDSDKIIEKIDELRKSKEVSESDSDGCVAGKESLKQLSKFLSTSAGNTFDLLIMRLSKMSQDNKSSVKSLKFKYIDMIRRCTESQELIGWILLDPEIATNVIQELTGLEVREIDNLPDFSSMTNERKKDYFLIKFKEMNKQFMNTLPKDVLTSDDWLVMLYKLEQLEGKLKEAFAKVTSPTKVVQTHGASEAEILAAKGLSKIIGKANVRIVKKTEPQKPAKKEVEVENQASTEKDDKKMKNDALLAKCEAILTSKGEKSLLDSFYTIKSYITQGLPVPESYKKHVISICSCIDARLLDEEPERAPKPKDDEEHLDCDNGSKDKNPLSVIGSQNPELLAKYSAQALRNAKQTLNAVAFRNLMRNGQSKSESDACDTPRTSCKWTNDCVCDSCKEDVAGVSIGDIIKQCYEEEKTKNGLEEKRREAKKPVQKSKSTPKVCENAMHPQHICKAGHGGPGGCAGDGGDQPCTCCYCTVFGHAPPLTTPVPRNFNETRERLRSILNKKKLKCKTNGEVTTEQAGKTPPAAAAAAQHPTHATPKPPALPKTLPPTLTTAQQQQQQRQLAEKMAKMAVSEVQEPKPPVQQKSAPAQTLRTDGRVNPNAMEQIRLQQLKQQQLQQMQQQLQQLQHQQDQQTQQQKQQSAPQKKPEPIYDLPIHNKPQLTPQQQQQIRQQQQQQQQQQLLRQQQLQQQQIQQQQLQQQQLQQQQQMQQQQAQQRQARQQQRPAVSLSSRDTSVFSTSSGCSGGSCWRGAGRAEDPRDLDALLQYIEGPARHVDRGKKKAKKQRQRAKKTEARLSEMAERLRGELAEGRLAAAALRDAHAAAERQVRGARQALAQHRPRRKGKKHKVNPEQQSNMHLLGEILADYTSLVNSTAKELENVEKRVSDCSKQLQQVERELSETRSMMDGQIENENMVHNQKHNVLVTSGPRAEVRQEDRRPTVRPETTPVPDLGGMVRVRRAGPGGVTLSLAGQPDPALGGLLRASEHLTVLNVRDSNATNKQAERKQTWEQAIAHMNQLAKGAQKEKKKQQKEPPKQEEKVKPAAETMSKKQRKLLAKQQAEEEKRKQELEKKKQEKKTEAVKENNKKDKKEQKKEAETKKTKEDKKENKKHEEKLGKENKQVKNVQTTTKSKSSKKATNISAASGIDVEKPASCSIMEQLSCGVQVADLRLPPGITLTRVQPYEKKEPAIKSVPLWKCGQLPATPTPPVRPPPVISADPNTLVFSTQQPEPPKAVLVPEPQPQPAAKSKKAKKKAKKAAAAENAEQKQDGAKMVTLRNPMFHPNLPPVQITNNQPQKKSEIRIPDPIPMPPTPCQATITPTSNGMYTIRNPLMSMMHQHSLMGMRNPAPQVNPMFTPPQYNYVNPNTYTPQPQYVLDPSRSSPKAPENDFQNRIMNLASFTQKNDEGYSLFKTSDDNQQKSFLVPEYFENHSPKVVSPNPIGTRPEQNRNYEDSLFVKPIQRPEPIGTPLKKEEERPEYAGLYTPFGQVERSNVFRTALFDKSDSKVDEGHMNGDQLPYFQRLRAGSKLNSEVTIHYVTDSKYYKGQEVQQEMQDESLFSRPQTAWTHPNQSSVYLPEQDKIIRIYRTGIVVSPTHHTITRSTFSKTQKNGAW